MSTQVILVSTLYQAANIAGLIESGALGSSEKRRILVIANNSYAPELVPAVNELSGFESIKNHFDHVVNWNATVWPGHPKSFGINPSRAIIFRRLLEHEWGLEAGEKVDLILESLPGAPAGNLAEIFWDCEISVHSDGLMSYGPIRQPLSRSMYQRLRKVFHTDLLPNLQPLQLAEHNPQRHSLSPNSVTAVFRRMAEEAVETFGENTVFEPHSNTAVILGQYLANIDLISHSDEVKLHIEMLHAAHKHGCTRIIFKPHPTATFSVTSEMQSVARALGIDFVVADVPVLAEVIFALAKPRVAVSCFSTALITARACFGIETIAVGTDIALETVTPYHNSNRIPITIIDYLHAPEPVRKSLEHIELSELVTAVSYCMQPKTLDNFRSEAIAFLQGLSPELQTRYFKRRRLTKLDLPGALPPQSGTRKLKGHARRAVRFGKRVARQGVEKAQKMLMRSPNE
ncbi:polysialyltransferase family glycosyltransferase [Brevibacterium paucivorans]